MSNPSIIDLWPFLIGYLVFIHGLAIKGIIHLFLGD